MAQLNVYITDENSGRIHALMNRYNLKQPQTVNKIIEDHWRRIEGYEKLKASRKRKRQVKIALNNKFGRLTKTKKGKNE